MERIDRSLGAFLSYSKVVLRFLTENHLKLEEQEGEAILNLSIIGARKELINGLRLSKVEESVNRYIEKDLPRTFDEEDLRQASEAGLMLEESKKDGVEGDEPMTQEWKEM